MTKFLRTFVLFLIFLIVLPVVAASASKDGGGDTPQGATKKERSLILEGNRYYTGRKFQEALNCYNEALKDNPKSSVAAFNVALANMGVAASMKGQDSIAQDMAKHSMELFRDVAQRYITKNNLSSKAFYNLGNMAFLSEDYATAIDCYKNALRLNPADNDARKNLRIAQKKQQQQDKDKNKQDQQQQNQQQNQPQNQPQQPQKPQQLDNQTSQQILNNIERRENQTRMQRARQNPENKGERGFRSRSSKQW